MIKTDTIVWGVEWTTWQTFVLNCARIERTGMWGGRTPVDDCPEKTYSALALVICRYAEE